MTTTLIASVRLGDASRMRFYPQAQGPSLYPFQRDILRSSKSLREIQESPISGDGYKIGVGEEVRKNNQLAQKAKEQRVPGFAVLLSWMLGQLPVAYLYWIESRKLFYYPTGWAVAIIFEAFPMHTIYSNFADFITYNGVALTLSGFVYAGTTGWKQQEPNFQPPSQAQSASNEAQIRQFRPSTLTLPGTGPVTSLTHKKLPWRSISRKINTNGVSSMGKLLHKFGLMWIWTGSVDADLPAVAATLMATVAFSDESTSTILLLLSFPVLGNS
ncbi:hypothetical protein F5882DRAFT_462127 [Hyaloscypha sp. PMI_1271]|nr:hypothetical protein F5882DRAFT_462127 [Hyaloscypha sp. PMI_1271]